MFVQVVRSGIWQKQEAAAEARSESRSTEKKMKFN